MTSSIPSERDLYQTSTHAKNSLDNINNGFGNIFIKNLDVSITVEGVYEMFSFFGDITSCKVQYDKNGVSTGLAFIDFVKGKDAEKAITAVNGKMIHGRTVTVAKFVPRNVRAVTDGDLVICTVKNFANNFDESCLKELFGVYGEVVSVEMIVDDDGVSMGFGFVSFRDQEDAEEAISTINGRVIHGNIVEMAKLTPRNEPDESHEDLAICVVKNFANNFDESSLREWFEVYGEVVSVGVMRNRVGASMGLGFVSFRDHEEAMNAVNGLNGRVVNDKAVFVARTMTESECQRVHKDKLHPQQLQQGQDQVQLTFRNLGQLNFMPRPVMNMQLRLPINMFTSTQQRHNMMQIPPPKKDPNLRAYKVQKRPQYKTDANSACPGNEVQYADTVEAKQIIGEKIYPLVLKHAGDMAGKITGMFLELDNADLLYMIENEESLRMKIEEAVDVLKVYKSEPATHIQ